MGSPNTWIAIIKSLPASLVFIFIVDWVLLSDLVDLYKAQMEKADEFKIAILCSIIALVAVNLVIISFFARAKLLEDKQLRLASSVNELASAADHSKPKGRRKKATENSGTSISE